MQEYRAGSDAAGAAVNELEQQKSKVKAELAEVCRACLFYLSLRSVDYTCCSWMLSSSVKSKMFKRDWRSAYQASPFFLFSLTSFGLHLQVDLRASVGLEGYRRNIGDEIGAFCIRCTR